MLRRLREWLVHLSTHSVLPGETGEPGRSARLHFEELAEEHRAPARQARRTAITRQAGPVVLLGLLAGGGVAAVVHTLLAGLAAEAGPVQIASLLGLAVLVVATVATRNLGWGAAAGVAVGLPVGLLQPPAAGLAGLAGAATAGGAILGWWRQLPPPPGELPQQVRFWRQGADGEEETAALLQPLHRRGWKCLHDLACPDSQANIDHLAVGPTGVFVIDSKKWRAGRVHVDDGRLHLDGDARPPGALAYEADEVRRVLDDVLGLVRADLRAVVAIHGATVPAEGLRLDHADVVAADGLVAYLEQPTGLRLDQARIEAVALAASRRLQPAGSDDDGDTGGPSAA